MRAFLIMLRIVEQEPTAQPCNEGNRAMKQMLSVALIATALLPARVDAQPPDSSWIGRKVVTLYGVLLRRGDQVVDDQGRSRSLTSSGKDHQDFRIYRVESVDGTGFRITAENENASGWVSADEILPLDLAILYYSSQIDADPSNACSYSRRGLIRIAGGAIDLALADFDQAIRLDSMQEVFYLNRGVARRSKKAYALALADFDKAIELDPNYGVAFLNRGIVWAEKRDFDRAISDFTQAIGIDPKSSWAFNNRGLAWLEKKQQSRALSDFDQAIKFAPNNERALRNRASIRRDRGDYAGALEDLSRAIRADHTNPAGYNARAWLRATCPIAKFRDGRAALEDSLRSAQLRKQRDAFDLGTLAAVYADRGEYSLAVAAQERAQALYKAESDLGAGWARLVLYKEKKPYREFSQNVREDQERSHRSESNDAPASAKSNAVATHIHK
jgi:Tfp pilus assembly protein PilF